MIATASSANERQRKRAIGTVEMQRKAEKEKLLHHLRSSTDKLDNDFGRRRVEAAPNQGFRDVSDSDPGLAWLGGVVVVPGHLIQRPATHGS